MTLQGNTPTGQVWVAIGLCHNATVESALLLNLASSVAGGAEPESSLVCALCEYLLKEAAVDLPANFSLEELQQDLYDTCTHVGSLKAECDSLVCDVDVFMTCVDDDVFACRCCCSQATFSAH